MKGASYNDTHTSKIIHRDLDYFLKALDKMETK